jgi:hypothetical protein
MKKLLTLIILFAINGYGQKSLEIYNTTTLPVRINDIVTNVSGSYPEYHSKPAWGLITVAPVTGSYILTNSLDLYRFPFHSPTSSPYLSNWDRINSATSTTTGIPSTTAWTFGAPQVFDSLLFTIGGNDYKVSVSNPLITGPGGSWTALYDYYDDPFSDIIIYTVLFY